MSEPWLPTLPPAARLFFSIAQAGVARGLSANSILAAYKAAGPGIRRKVGLEVIRRVRGVELKASATKHIRKNLHPDVGTIPTALTSLLRNYSYKVKYQGITEDGRIFESHVTVATDSLLTPDEALQQAHDYLEDMPDEYGIEEITAVSFEGVKKNPRLTL